MGDNSHITITLFIQESQLWGLHLLVVWNEWVKMKLFVKLCNYYVKKLWNYVVCDFRRFNEGSSNSLWSLTKSEDRRHGTAPWAQAGPGIMGPPPEHRQDPASWDSPLSTGRTRRYGTPLFYVPNKKNTFCFPTSDRAYLNYERAKGWDQSELTSITRGPRVETRPAYLNYERAKGWDQTIKPEYKLRL
jgi:hypothetical protein